MENIVNKLKRILFLWAKNSFWLLPHSINASQERVFMGGMQRSGSNMLIDILEKSYATNVFYGRNSRAFDNYQMREEAVIQELCDRSRAPEFIIKPLNLDNLMANFQPVKTIWIVRDYHDVVASMLKSLCNMEKQVLRILKGISDEWLGQGMADKTREEFIAMAEPGMGNTSASAMQWYFRNRLFFDQKFESNDQVLLISYEQLVSQPETQVKKICNFISIEYYMRMLKDVFSSSIKRRKQPDINPQIRELLCDALQFKIKITS